MGTFTLDSSRLEGVEEDTVESLIADRGRFIELAWSQGGANQDMELFGWSLRYMPGEAMTMAAPADAFVAADYAYVDTPLEDRARAIQLEWSVDGADEDMELLGFGLRYAPGEGHAAERS